jgi:hypothetical protein
MTPASNTKGASVVQVAACVLGIKAYSVLLLYVVFRDEGVREGYEPFLVLAEGQGRAERLREVQASFLERLAPYDGQYYLDIAGRGYRRFEGREAGIAAGAPGNYAFFPLLPAALRLAAPLGRRGALAACLAANLLLSSAGAVLLYRLALGLGVPAWPSVLFLLSFPTAVFQSALYTESAFLFLSLAAALAAATGARRGSWAGAAAGYLAGLCRPQGMLVSALGLGRLRRRRGEPRRGRAEVLADLALVFAPLLGIATFAMVLQHSIGAPLGFLGIQRSWARDFSAKRLIGELLSPSSYGGPPFDLLALVLGVGLLPFLWRHLPRSLALFGTLSVVLPLSTGTALSFGRFLSVSFPHFLCLSKLFASWPVARAVLLASFIVLQCFLAKGLIGWHFVG